MKVETLAWILAVSFGGMFFGTTKADVVKKGPFETYQLSYFTTEIGSEVFSFAFERMAEQLCPEGYEVVDKTNQPNDPANARTKWLIACNSKK